MKGFKEFLMRGNLIELAVAVIVGGVFTNVVTAFTNMIMDVIGQFGQVPDFSRTSIFGIGVGAFLSALLAFLFTSSIVYFLIVLPYNRLAELRKTQTPAAGASTEDLLAEIRDLLRQRAVVPGPWPQPPGPVGPYATPPVGVPGGYLPPARPPGPYGGLAAPRG